MQIKFDEEKSTEEVLEEDELIVGVDAAVDEEGNLVNFRLLIVRV